MSNPIRIQYRQNADYFAESQRNPPIKANWATENNQRILFGLVIVGTYIYFFGEERQKGTPVWELVAVGAFMIIVGAGWLWFFKKIGLGKKKHPPGYEWTEKDRERYKRHHPTEGLVNCEFEESGFSFGLEGGVITKYSWSMIQRVVERPGGLYVFKSRMFYFWFPKAAFSTEADFQSTLKIIEAKVPVLERCRIAYIALGSNLGDSRQIISRAVDRLQEFSDVLLLKSSLIETAPVDCPPGSPNFVNAVVGIVPHSSETPETLLAKLRELEKEFGRQPKKVMNEARPLDLDLIAFGEETRNTPELVLPHSRAHLRRFVLQPLSEIAPEFVLPGQTKTVATLLAELPAG